jgi:signal transduction histidine kinase
MKVQPEPVDAVVLAREAALLVEPLIHEKGLTFTLHAPDDRIRLVTDPGLLKQILVNLLNNAMKFTDAGEISLDVAQDGQDLYCTVRDTGIGIAPDQLERIFEPFHQVLRDGRQPLEGTGLGLTVSRRLARLLGGDVTVESKLGEGSRFTVRCPLRMPPSPQRPD